MKNAFDNFGAFQFLVSEYRLVDDAAKKAAPEAAAVIDNLITDAKSNQIVSNEMICTLEIAMLDFLDKEQLVSKFIIILDKFKEVAGEKHCTDRLRIKPADCANASEVAIRAQIREIIKDLHEHLALYTECRKSRNSVLRRTVIPMSVLFLGFIAWLGWSNGEIPPVVYVIVAGSIGAMVSMIRRIQSSSGTDTNVLTSIDLAYDRLNIYLAPAYGSVFSVVLLLFFASKLLNGDIFPTIVTMDEELADNAETVAEVMKNFIINTFPETGIDCAKLIIWSFIAGFAEKFVPDTLDRLVTRSEKNPEQALKQI